MSSILDWVGRKVSDIVAMGYPEEVAKKMSSGELPMDLASRAERAKAMGGDLMNPQYHGSKNDILEFLTGTKGKMGAGVYSSPDPRVANRYATPGFNPNRDISQLDPEVLNEELMIGSGANLMPIVPLGNRANRMEAMRANPELTVLDGVEELARRVRAEGYQGMDAGDAIAKQTIKESVTYDPKNIRSVNAAFDPEYKGPNILGSLAALGVGGAALTGSEDAEAGMKDVIVKKADDAVTDAYRGSHIAPDADYGGPINDLGQIMPDDVYGPMGERYYGFGDKKVDNEVFAALRKAKDNPDAEIDVYRAVPKGVDDMFIGDWVTTSKEYAKKHGENALDGEYDILKSKVPAKKLQSEGYPYEFGILPAVSAMAVGLGGANEADAAAINSGMPMAMQAAGQSGMNADPGRDFGNAATIMDFLLPLVAESVKPVMMGNAELTDEQRRRGYYNGVQ